MDKENPGLVSLPVLRFTTTRPGRTTSIDSYIASSFMYIVFLHISQLTMVNLELLIFPQVLNGDSEMISYYLIHFCNIQLQLQRDFTPEINTTVSEANTRLDEEGEGTFPFTVLISPNRL